LAGAIADDVRTAPPDGPVVRVVLRWFEEADPAYFTVHVLGAHERGDVAPGDAWYPLEWPNVDREIDRTDRVSADREVVRAGEVLKALYESAVSDGPTAAIVEVVRALPPALKAAGVALDPELAVSAAHFEGFGALDVLRDVATSQVLAALEARGELPVE
jgi:hypothetical protein